MDVQRVNDIALLIDRDVKFFTDFTRNNIAFLNQDIINQGRVISQTLEVQVSEHEIFIIRTVTCLQTNATYHILRTLYHASPSLIAILLVIWGVIKFIWDVIKIVIDIINIIQALHVDDLMYKLWPWYAEQIDKIRAFITDVSEALGWGVDGLMHLLNATTGAVGIYGGLTGKSEDWFKMQSFVKMESTLKTLETFTTIGYKDPSTLLAMIFEVEERDTLGWLGNWSGDNLDKIISVTTMAEKALRDAGDIGNELLAIRVNMPSIIAQNIPASIWSGLESFNNVIYDDILPTVSAINNKLEEANRLIDMYSDQLSNVARKLLKPGDLLLGVDNLIDPVRVLQEQAIDDVASREFQRIADENRAAISGDLDEFDRIDEALSAPTPPPVFMTIEDPKRRAILGIVYEPGETWFLPVDL